MDKRKFQVGDIVDFKPRHDYHGRVERIIREEDDRGQLLEIFWQKWWNEGILDYVASDRLTLFLEAGKGSFSEQKMIPEDGQEVWVKVYGAPVYMAVVNRVLNESSIFVEVMDANGQTRHVDWRCVFDHEPQKVTKADDLDGEYIVWE